MLHSISSPKNTICFAKSRRGEDVEIEKERETEIIFKNVILSFCSFVCFSYYVSRIRLNKEVFLCISFAEYVFYVTNLCGLLDED